VKEFEILRKLIPLIMVLAIVGALLPMIMRAFVAPVPPPKTVGGYGIGITWEKV